MALNYDYSHIMTGKSQGLGAFWVSIKVDWNELCQGAFQNRGAVGIPASTDFKLGKLKGGTVIRDSYYRVLTACSTAVTYNIGVTEAGTEIAAAVDGATPGDWVQGSYDPNDSIGSLAKATEDHYIWVMLDNGVNVSDGILEIMLECVAGADDNY
jgi:hypothetical protein